MKRTIGLLLVLAAISASAEETTMVLPVIETSQIKAVELKSEVRKQNPNWKFRIGQANGNFGSSETDQGKGLSVGLAYQINSLFSLGATYSKMKVEHSYVSYDEYTNERTEYKSSESLNVMTADLGITPIRYEYKDVQFAGSVLLGASGIGTDVGPYYGAGLIVSLNQEIGVGFNTKVRVNNPKIENEFETLNEVSLVGYF